MEDKTIVCKDCGKEFIFTVREQEFYKENKSLIEFEKKTKRSEEEKKALDDYFYGYKRNK